LTATASEEDELHREMVMTVFDELKKRGFVNLRANFENVTPPERILEFVPDFTFNKNDPEGKFVVFEVETCSSMIGEDTGRKWKAFFEKAKAVGGEFHLAVPKMCGGNSGRALADEQLGKMQIKADLVWAVNGSLQHRILKRQGQRW
jgi:hypothetical protein